MSDYTSPPNNLKTKKKLPVPDRYRSLTLPEGREEAGWTRHGEKSWKRKGQGVLPWPPETN